MSIPEYITKHNLTNDDLDAMAEPYEKGDYISEDGEIFSGPHINETNKKQNQRDRIESD